MRVRSRGRQRPRGFPRICKAKLCFSGWPNLFNQFSSDSVLKWPRSEEAPPGILRTLLSERVLVTARMICPLSIGEWVSQFDRLINSSHTWFVLYSSMLINLKYSPKHTRTWLWWPVNPFMRILGKMDKQTDGGRRMNHLPPCSVKATDDEEKQGRPRE